jgi:hypothetical protein
MLGIFALNGKHTSAEWAYEILRSTERWQHSLCYHTGIHGQLICPCYDIYADERLMLKMLRL